MNYTKKSHGDIANGVTIVATLDWNTCVACGALDGKHYQWDEMDGKLPPHHEGCRCITVLWLKSPIELGLPDIGNRYRKRASAIGQVSQDMTYCEWIKLHPSAQ